MKLKFKTIMTQDKRFVWDGYDDAPDTSDRPVLLKEDEAEEYLAELIKRLEDDETDLGALRICDVVVEVSDDRP
jgi:hypothetical protein